MPTQSFTSGNDSFVIRDPGTYDLNFLAGEDVLTVIGGTFTTAHMGDDDDLVSLRSGDASVFGELGNDRFEIYANGVEADGGDGSDLFNLRGGSGQSVAGGLGVDRFNIYAGITDALVHGNDGNDDFYGYYHSVTGSIFGDAGDDYFITFVGGVTINGGTGNDIFRADATNPATYVELAGQGIDSVQVARGASYTLPANVERISVQGFHGTTLDSATLIGNSLDNTINAHVNVETIYGLGGNDRISAKAGADTLDGGEGDDFLDGGADNDIIIGGLGNDTLQGRTGDDSMTGGAGDDTYYVDSLADVVTEGSGQGSDTARVSITGYTLTDNVERGIVFGSAGISLSGNVLDNVLIGNAGGDELSGGDGNDSLSGAAGDDILLGDFGTDTLSGGDGGDLLFGGAGSDVLTGGAGDDQLSPGSDLDNDMMSGGLGDDSYGVLTPADTVVELANSGIDTVNCVFNTFLMTAYTLPDFVENGTIDPNSPNGGELHGNALDNVLIGGNYGDVLDGSAGDDTMSGGLSGDSYMVDSAGDVVIEIGLGIDHVRVSIPNYTLPTNVENGTLTVAGELDGNASINVLQGSSGNDILYGFAGDDTLNGNDGSDQLFGGDDRDDLSGGAGDDAVNGGSGSDQLQGGNGDDILSGGIDNDSLLGGDGADQLDGGLGADNMIGGIGTDTFRYTDSGESPLAAFDTIRDFLTGTDKIDLSAIDANTSVAGNQAFTYNPLGGKGTVLWLPSGDGYDVFADVDGGGADFKIHVVTSGLVAADFIL
jgi:Ca2+-binding RTX toxin-like protein